MSELQQARDGIIAQIAVNRSTVTLKRNELVSDGFGGYVDDPTGSSCETHKIKCRIPHESKGPMETQSSPAGFTSKLARYIMVDYKTMILEGDTFDWKGKQFEIGPVDPLYYNDEVIGYQAPLKEAIQ